MLRKLIRIVLLTIVIVVIGLVVLALLGPTIGHVYSYSGGSL